MNSNTVYVYFIVNTRCNRFLRPWRSFTDADGQRRITYGTCASARAPATAKFDTEAAAREALTIYKARNPKDDIPNAKIVRVTTLFEVIE